MDKIMEKAKIYGWRVYEKRGDEYYIVLYNVFRYHRTPEDAVEDMLSAFGKMKNTKAYNKDSQYKFEVVPMDMDED